MEKLPWFKRTNRQTLQERVSAVQNVNDPSIIADDIQRWSVRIIALLLVFTTFLSAFSYYKFFEKSFGIVAVFMAVILAIAIEFGKNWGLKKSLQIPFFMGWKYIWSEVENSFIWVGPTLLAIATFSASVYNSTHGAKELSLMLNNERNYVEFKPNTLEVDAQINSVSNSIDNAMGIKWKGTTTEEATRFIKRQSPVLNKLQTQKQILIDQQRKDWENQNEIRANQGNFSSNSLLMVGGFIEFLQLVLMFMRVAAERSLDRTATDKNAVAAVPQQQQHTTATPQRQNAIIQNPSLNKTPIQFMWEGYGMESSAQKNAVEAVPQRNNDPQRPHSNFVEKTVAQSPQQTGSDQALRLLRQTLIKELPNFNNPQARSNTVFCRIENALNECLKVIREPSFCPTQKTFFFVFEYLYEVAFPAISNAGFLYAFEGQYFDIYNNHSNFAENG